MAISSEIAYARDFAEEARKLEAEFGRTTLFSTGAPELDEYLGGGFGRKHGYEIVVLFGPTKIGKSSVALNFVADAIKKGQRVGILNLEDDGPDVFLRLCRIVGKTAADEYILKGTTVHLMPPAATRKTWKLGQLISLLQDWYTNRGVELILLDHIQFAFENADFGKDSEYQAQRQFMRHLNGLMRKLKKTIILVSHVNKNPSTKGVNQIVGSGGIAAAGTKLLELSKHDGALQIQEHGSRFTPTPDYPHRIELDNLRLRDWTGRL